MGQSTNVLATELGESHVGHQVTIIDPMGGAVTGKLRNVARHNKTTKLLVNISTTRGASNLFMELTVLSETVDPSVRFSLNGLLPSTQVVSVTA